MPIERLDNHNQTPTHWLVDAQVNHHALHLICLITYTKSWPVGGAQILHGTVIYNYLDITKIRKTITRSVA
jgi:hypothetical protein